VFQRIVAPEFGFFIMNRLSTENLLVLLTPEVVVETLGDYIIYKSGTSGRKGFMRFFELVKEMLLILLPKRHYPRALDL
jgi:hypothetical protein